MKKKILKTFLVILLLTIATFFLYFNNTRLVDPETVSFYHQLKETLEKDGFSSSLVVVSTKRFRWHNALQVKTAGAAKNSRHLKGDALDFIVFDINNDGISDNKDVDIAYDILDKQIIINKGGIGTYKSSNPFIYRQMIHIDSRGYRARWVE